MWGAGRTKSCASNRHSGIQTVARPQTCALLLPEDQNTNKGLIFDSHLSSYFFPSHTNSLINCIGLTSTIDPTSVYFSPSPLPLVTLSDPPSSLSRTKTAFYFISLLPSLPPKCLLPHDSQHDHLHHRSDSSRSFRKTQPWLPLFSGKIPGSFAVYKAHETCVFLSLHFIFHHWILVPGYPRFIP